jgi:hypothetical protein
MKKVCENKRMMQLFEDFGNRPVVFIRFNPDSYDENGNKHQSSFKYGKLGIPGIRNKKEWNSRLVCLKETIEFGISHIPQKEIIKTFVF